MTASSAPLPQRRREALRQQLLDARSRGDQREIARSEQQWVHRYGVAALSEVELQRTSVAEVVPLPLPGVETSEVSVAPPAVAATAPAQASRFDRFKTVLKGCLDDVGSTVETDASIPAAVVAPSDVPPPPSPRLQRLRRWLPTVVDDLPRAS